jgi:uncharacterized DUF497 family protein
MPFEFDPAKSASNLVKHGIDFEKEEIWMDPDRQETPARWVDEPRTRVLGRIGETVWAAIVMRHENTIRLISVRRARAEEIREHEEIHADDEEVDRPS